MGRSAAAIFAVLILPAFALAQAPERSHTVVDDDTLWDLAQRYYQDPWDWRVIWEANRSAIEDPNLIYPDQVFVIPGLPADRTAQTDPPPDPPRGGGEPADPPASEDPPRVTPDDGTSPADRRTIFYQNEPTPPSVVELIDSDYLVVDSDQVYSAPWLVPLGDSIPSLGSLLGFAHETDRGSTARQFHQVRLVTDAPLRVGMRLRSYRVARTVADVGRVVQPTGLLTVTALADSGAVAVVTNEYGRIQWGDLVGELPAFDLEAGDMAEPVSGGTEAMIMAMAGRGALADFGHLAFLDQGSDDGIGVGDEFVLYSDAVATEERGALQVVSVTPRSSTARITNMTDDVFRQGVIVRLVRSMP